MDVDLFVAIVVAVLGGNTLTLIFVYAAAQIARAERIERETGNKVDVPTYMYLCAIIPPLLMSAGAYYLKLVS